MRYQLAFIQRAGRVPWPRPAHTVSMTAGTIHISTLDSQSSFIAMIALRQTGQLEIRQSQNRPFSTALSPRSDKTPENPTRPDPSYLPVDFRTSSRIDGEESQVLTIELSPGQGVRAEAGAMVFMTDSIEMTTQLLSGAMARFFTGQSVFLTDYVCNEKPGTVCLGTDFYSKIVRLDLNEYGGSLVCQRGAFLAGNAGIAIEMEFTKSLTAGFFGGQGFILQRLTGEGDVFVKAGGALVVKDLKEGELLRVSSGSIVAFERGMEYDVQMMKGIRNAMFGGEGLFVTTLTGPGRVWLQGMPPDRMIAEIAQRVPPGIGLGIPIGMGTGGGSGAVGEEESSGVDVSGTSNDAVAGSESLTATDAAKEADRHATVAASGVMGSEAVDAESPEALFGDAAPKPHESADFMDSTSFADSASSEADVSDSFSTLTSEPSFDDSPFSSEFSENADEFVDGELFDDTTSTSGASEEGGGGGIISTLWDLFMGGDD